MPKTLKYFVDLGEPIKEWGVSRYISTAVPIVASGAEIKSTRDVSNAMHSVLRSKLDPKTVKQIKVAVAKAKKAHGPAKFVFQTGRRSSQPRVSIARRASKNR